MGGLRTGVNPSHLYATSQMVSKYGGMLVQPNKAIVGANAVSHHHHHQLAPPPPHTHRLFCCCSDELMGGLRTGVNPSHLYTTSQMVSKYSGMLVQPNKAIVGANAFSHESGMHQDGMLKHRETYQIMSPETIGLKQNSADAGVWVGALGSVLGGGGDTEVGGGG